MRATSWTIGALTSVLALLGMAGCSASASAPPGGPVAGAAPAEVTLADAQHVFSRFVVADDVARAADDELLGLSLVGEAQKPLTVSAYQIADYSGTPVARYRYGVPQLYVPELKEFPLWFAAAVARTPAHGGPTRTAVMVFSRETAADTWRLTMSTLLEPGMAMPRIALDLGGRAAALATFAPGLLVSPNSVGALHAAVADDGPAAAAASIVAAGPDTTGLYYQIERTRHLLTQPGLHYGSVFSGTVFPLYALRTADGGALVLYALGQNTVISLTGQKQGRQIPVPPAFAPIMYASGRLIIQSELDTGETYQYAAYVPPSPGAHGKGKMRVLASDGSPTSIAGQ